MIESEVFRVDVSRCTATRSTGSHNSLAILLPVLPWANRRKSRFSRGVSSMSKRLLIRDPYPSKTGIDLSQGSSPDEPILALMLFAERFKCRECGAWYAATWEQSLSRQPAPGTFNCKDCGTVVHSWSGIDRYTDWRLLQRAYSELTAPIEAPAVAALFNDPARAWSLPDLARLCNMSALAGGQYLRRMS